MAAHAHSADGIETAIRAGVDSIEHASLIDDEGTRLAKEKGTVMVMDIYVDTFCGGLSSWGQCQTVRVHG